MNSELKIRLIFAKPTDYWLSEKEVERGYWGFVRCRRDYEQEKASIKRQFKDLIENLRYEGISIELLPEIEIQNLVDLLRRIDEIERSDVNVILAMFPIGWRSSSDIIYGIVAASKYAIFFDKFKPNTYAGTLFTPPAYQMLKQHELANNVFLVEGDVEKLKAILRAIYGLKRISSAKLVCVGDCCGEEDDAGLRVDLGKPRQPNLKGIPSSIHGEHVRFIADKGADGAEPAPCSSRLRV